mgnify:CR=1 FL=1
MKTNIISILLFALSFTSCKKAVLGPELAQSPEALFDFIWDDYDQHCGILFPKKVNWDSIYNVYRPQVTVQTSEHELWNILVHMLDELDDEHTFIEDNLGDIVHVSGSKGIDEAIASFSYDLIEEKYLAYSKTNPWSATMQYGQIAEKSIGYIHLGDVDGYHSEQTMDTVLAEIGKYQAIIFDVRNNGGGSGEFAQLITNPFAEATRLVMTTQVRSGPAHDAFDPMVELKTENDGLGQFTKPVVVLTDRFSVSGAEHITLYLKSNSHVTHIGSTTAGALSATGNRRFLPNGWEYQYPIEMILTAEGESLEGIGVVPDVKIKNTPEDIEAGRDLVLEKAIQFLYEQHGIE